jgi:AcrR family transcriptional regulator
MEAAREVLNDKSILQATVDEFARAAGVARGTFYIYFADRYDLVLQLYRDITKGLYEQSSVEHDPSLSTFDHIRIPILRVFYHFKENIGVLRAVEQLIPTHPELAELSRSSKAAYLDRICLDIADSIARDRARPIDPRIAALAIDSMVERISLLWFGHDRAPFADAEIEYVVQQLSLLVYRAIFAQEPHLA